MHRIRSRFITEHAAFGLCLLVAASALGQTGPKEIMARPQGR